MGKRKRAGTGWAPIVEVSLAQNPRDITKDFPQMTTTPPWSFGSRTGRRPPTNYKSRYCFERIINLYNITFWYIFLKTGVEPRFFFGLCPVSLRTALRPRPPELTCAPGRRPADPALKACSGCLSVCYAGREEQKADWKRHKKVCKVLQPLGEWVV